MESKDLENLVKETKYLSVNPAVQFGQPCVKGTRIPVHVIQSMHKAGDSIELICELYQITKPQVNAALKSSAKPISDEKMNEWYRHQKKNNG